MEHNALLRVTDRSPQAGEMAVCVEGRLDEGTLSALAEFVSQHAGGGPLTIELDGLTSLDCAGRNFLIGMRERGCRLRGGSLYIHHLLREACR